MDEDGSVSEHVPMISHTKTNSDSKTVPNVQRTVPYRSMSFSHVDYSPQDGKYVRRRKIDVDDTGTSTVPRKKNTTDSDLFEKSNDISTDDEVTKILQNITISEDAALEKDHAVMFSRLSPEEGAAEVSEGLSASEDKKRDRSKRRKGMYISQWPEQKDIDDDESVVENEVVSTETVQKFDPVPILEFEESHKLVPYNRNDSLSENESEHIDRRSITPNRDNQTITESDTEIRNNIGSPRPPRRYSKRPIRGPYGQMLEAEMKKPSEHKNYCNKHSKNDLKFLEDFPVTVSVSVPSTDNFEDSKRTSNRSLDSTLPKNNLKLIARKSNNPEISSSAPTSVLESDIEENRLFTHHRTTSSPSKLEAIPVGAERTTNIMPSSELLHELLRGSSERLTVASLSDSNPTIGVDSIIQVVSTLCLVFDTKILTLNDRYLLL